MIQTIYKGTDLVFNIKLEDKDGIPFRVRNTSEFILRLYTTKSEIFRKSCIMRREGLKSAN